MRGQALQPPPLGGCEITVASIRKRSGSTTRERSRWSGRSGACCNVQRLPFGCGHCGECERTDAGEVALRV